LINLFDIWMVFVVALLLAFVQAGVLIPSAAKSAAADRSEPAFEDMRSRKAQVTKMRITKEKLTGEGQRLGTAYRLKSGQVVYVPDPPSSP
jgi:hypothetical protein